MFNDRGHFTTSSITPVFQGDFASPWRVTCDNCKTIRAGEDPLDALDAADRAGWRLVEVGNVTNQLCPKCVRSRVGGDNDGVAVWRLCDEFVRRLAGRPRRELPLMPPRGVIKEVVIHAAMMASAGVFAPQYLEHLLPLSWWMRRQVRIEPLNTARQVAIVLLAEARIWNKSNVARSFGRSAAVSSWASRCVRDRLEVDPEFREHFEEAQRRFRESMGLMFNGEGRR